MTIRVKVPTQLRSLADGNPELVVEQAGTVGQLLDSIKSNHPELIDRILDDDGEIRRFINVFVGDEDVRFLQGLQTSLEGSELISILPAVAGGSS